MCKKTGLLVIFLLSISLPIATLAADKWLIATQSEALNTGQKISLDALKPDSLSDWPEKLQLKLSSSNLKM